MPASPRSLVLAGLTLLASLSMSHALWAGDTKASVFDTEAEVRQLIEGSFSPPGSCKLVLESRSRAEAMEGRFSRMALRVEAGRVKGLSIRSAVVDVRDVALDVPRMRREGILSVHSAAAVTYHAEVTEAGLNWLISGNKKLGKDRPPRLALRDGVVILDGHLTLALFNSSFRLKGRLQPRHERQVDFVPEAFSLGWLTLPGFVLEAAADRLNPVITLDKVVEFKKCNVKIRQILVSPGLLTLEG